MKENKYVVLLYYKYIEIKEPEQIRDEQRAICESLNLKGRIIIAEEGINGTLEGTKENTEKYIKAMENSKYFSNIHWKKSNGNGNAFNKLSVKTRLEIVTTNIPNLNSKITGIYLTPEELHKWFLEKKEFYIVDMRNDFEYSSGFFEGFIKSDMKHFSDLPKVLPKISHLKNKTILTVCTGGIRCEKASGFLITNGFNDVYQLRGGIVSYMEKYPNEHFKGKLYVFDNRITMGFNIADEKHEIVGKCMLCGKNCDSYVNCEYNECHYHYISCDNCRDKETGLSFCKNECKEKYLQKNSQSNYL